LASFIFYASSTNAVSFHSLAQRNASRRRDAHQQSRSFARPESFAETHPPLKPYVVDHIKPLKRGGSDSPSNMQWQTKQEAKAKDKWE
jgi:hypothetical protein